MRYYNGDPQTLLTAEEEQKLARTIQDGLLAEKLLDAATPKELERYPDQTAQLLVAQDAGREAQRKLFECNILLAHYFALRSMNIGPSDPAAEVPGTFGDIRKLRSPRASMEDRMQIALAGLARAVVKFEPRVNEKTKKPTRFSSMASWEIHKDLSYYAHDNEVGGTRLPSDVRAGLSKAYNDPSGFSDEELDRLAAIRSRSESISLEELDLEATAPEEYENDWDGIPVLRADEVIADPDDDNDPFHAAHLNMARANLEEVLSTLTEREAGVIRLRFGLIDGEPRTFDEVGQVYGVTRERIRQLERRAMSKLRHPDRAGYFRNYFDEDLRSHDNRLTDNPYYIPRVTETIANVRTPEPADYHRDAIFNPETPAPKAPTGLESWQASPDDTWDAPMRVTPPNQEMQELAAEKLFNAMMRYVNPADFTHRGAETVAYPSNTITDILENCGKHLRPEHIETYWNTQLEKLVNRLKRANKDNFNLDRVSLLFSALLAETMRDEDIVELDVPDKLNKKINFFGSHLKQGSVIVNGDLGNFTAYSAGGTVELHVRGSIGDYGAAYSSGFVSLKIDSDTGEQFGHGVSDEVTLDVRGRIKSLAVSPDFKGTIVAEKVRKPTIGHKDIFVEKSD